MAFTKHTYGIGSSSCCYEVSFYFCYLLAVLFVSSIFVFSFKVVKNIRSAQYVEDDEAI